MNIALNTFEVQAQENGQFAVFIDGVHIAVYAREADALSDCARLQQGPEHPAVKNWDGIE
jgi:hypothetical protein